MAGCQLGPQMSHDPTDTQPCDWRVRFDALIADRMGQPFTWGAQDCCLFAADCAVIVGGADPASGLRGTYSDAASALRTLDSIGGIEGAGARFGAPIRPLMALTGDVGLVPCGDRESLAVCAGSVWLAPAAAGLAAMPFDAARMAWRVACPR
jgi:hypothetical protein